MIRMTRSPFEDVFNFQREVDRLFNQYWNDLPARATTAAPNALQVNTTEDGWRIDVPLPGIDPEHVSVEAAGNTLTIRAEEPGERHGERVVRYEQTLTMPQFLNLEKVTASHRHGLLQLDVPVKESVKPRRIQIEAAKEQKQLTTA